MIRILLEKLFYIILFFSLFMPNNGSLVVFGYTIRDVFLIILVFLNFFMIENLPKSKLNRLSFIFIFICFINELILKKLFFPNIESSLFYSFRMGLPLFCALSFFLFGFNFDILKVWKTISLAVIFSCMISLASVIFNIPLQNDELLSIETSGRIFNDNAGIGLIYLNILLYYRKSVFSSGFINNFAMYIGVVIMTLTFNRTFLFSAFLLVIFYFFSKKKFSISNLLKVGVIILFIIVITVGIYNNFPIIKDQIDQRILYIFDSSINSNDRLFENNRDMIYFGVIDAINKGYWVLGMPYSIPIFYNIYSSTYVNFTDTSLINILLRFGIFALILFLMIYRRMIKFITRNDKFLFYIFILLSLNVDIFFRHITILYIFIFWFFLVKNNKKSF